MVILSGMDISRVHQPAFLATHLGAVELRCCSNKFYLVTYIVPSSPTCMEHVLGHFLLSSQAIFLVKSRDRRAKTFPVAISSRLPVQN